MVTIDLNEDKDVVSMFAKNENCRYIHLYVIRNKDEFWHEPRLVAPVVNETINEGINEHVPDRKSVV